MISQTNPKEYAYNSKPYENREIDNFFSEVKERFDTQDKVLASILDQTKKTNGRVNKLELVKGIGYVGIIIVWTIVIPLVAYIYLNNATHTRDAILKLQTELSK